jgi:hypothetical protein
VLKGEPNPERRNARRFSLHLPLALSGRAEASCTANMSSGGVLFYLDSKVEVGAPIEFTVTLDRALLGVPQEVRVNCVGRVMRCSPCGQQYAVAVVIDEYHFERA